MFSKTKEWCQELIKKITISNKKGASVKNSAPRKNDLVKNGIFPKKKRYLQQLAQKKKHLKKVFDNME